jgi:hypothetical protein
LLLMYMLPQSCVRADRSILQQYTTSLLACISGLCLHCCFPLQLFGLCEHQMALEARSAVLQKKLSGVYLPPQ